MSYASEALLRGDAALQVRVDSAIWKESLATGDTAAYSSDHPLRLTTMTALVASDYGTQAGDPPNQEEISDGNSLSAVQAHWDDVFATS